MWVSCKQNPQGFYASDFFLNVRIFKDVLGRVGAEKNSVPCISKPLIGA